MKSRINLIFNQLTHNREATPILAHLFFPIAVKPGA